MGSLAKECYELRVMSYNLTEKRKQLTDNR
jgi:hypothetical protein